MDTWRQRSPGEHTEPQTHTHEAGQHCGADCVARGNGRSLCLAHPVAAYPSTARNAGSARSPWKANVTKNHTWNLKGFCAKYISPFIPPSMNLTRYHPIYCCLPSQGSKACATQGPEHCDCPSLEAPWSRVSEAVVYLLPGQPARRKLCGVEPHSLASPSL